MAVAAGANDDGEQAAARDEPTAPTTPAVAMPRLDPQLLMAARRGDSNELKRLLQPLEEKEATAPAPEVAVVIDDDGSPPPVAAHASACGRSSSLLFGETAMGDSLLHVVAAACGDGDGFVECAKTICGKKGGGRLLLACNKNGDTPLHCAASAGNATMISCLLDLADDQQGAMAMVRVQNQCGETALHHAVKRACCMMHNRPWPVVVDADYIERLACVDKLMAVDPELACIPHDGDGASPLYLAISLGEMEIARHLFTKTKGKLSYSGPDGRNVLHAAVSCANVQALGMVLMWLKQEAPKTPNQGGSSDDDLLKRLTSQGDKKNGSTPLHLAASLWGFPSTCIVPTWSWMWSGWRRVVIDELLGANASTAYQADTYGLYPIHVSAGVGSIDAIEMILERCPECASLRDGKGRTFLHVAVDKGMFGVVKYVCKTPEMSWMLNAMDDNGDTPLHRAVYAENLSVFGCLFWNPQVRLDVVNKEGMRPVDVAWSRMPLEAYYAWDPRIHIRNSLLKVAAPYGESSRGDLFKQKHADLFKQKHADDKTQAQLLAGGEDTTSANKHHADNTHQQLFEGGEGTISSTLTSAAQVMGILSVLVTTVTFASAFTLPGGYRADGGDAAGTPVLAGSYAFEAFVLADAMAFICSLLATSFLLYAGVPAFTLTDRFQTVNEAYGLMMHSARSLVAALGLGLYVALHPVARTIALVIAVWMSMLVYGFTKDSEGIDYMFSYPIIPRQKLSAWSRVLGWIIYLLERLWSYILIFGVPAIRKWARGR
ncbi:protein ACCELERATED CELL DEATH 6-like isoform X1 [Panicum virgatum]|uniref:protein ACCELERATED CELL DEATH 6-like isoform X1 n=1 Tax=Panicum virgatum TaxID=38727 RepID=UPI0019D5AAB4|nr:protein ACCELERATED CELL DEATH 6-like isoform X1 [Panicum virgatum]KAG2481299.1 hypothetical protein PVAP13_J042500 [Panicum virgatum]